MPNFFPQGTGEEGDEYGQQYRQVRREQALELKRQAAEREKRDRKDPLEKDRWGRYINPPDQS